MGSENEHQYPKNFIKIQSDSGSDIYYSLLYEGLPEEYKLYAEQKLNETEENRAEGLKILKDYMKKENLTCSDDDLLLILRCCKYNMTKCESKLKKYLRVRQNIGQRLVNFDDKLIEIILDDMMFGFLPYRDKDGRAILFTRPNVRLDLYSMADMETIGFSLILYILALPLTTVAGCSYIAEAKCESIYIFYPILKGYRSFLQNLIDLPMRVGRTDLLNENILCRLFYKAIRPILPKKFTTRLSFNGHSYENLKKIYHPDILPDIFEGNFGALSDKFYRERLLTFIKQLKAEYRNSTLEST